MSATDGACQPAVLSPSDPGNNRIYVAGVIYGLFVAVFGATYTTFARHGIQRGFTPFDLAAIRFSVSGILLLPMFLKMGPIHLEGVGWPRTLVFSALAGPLFALLVFAGFSLAPMAHGGVILPASITLSGIVMSAAVFGDHLGRSRWVGVGLVFVGLGALGGDALINGSGFKTLVGDCMFFLAGTSWAGFGILVRRWRTEPIHAAAAVSVFSAIIYMPLYLVFSNLHGWSQLDFGEIVLQLAIQGAMAGVGNLFVFAKAVELLGPVRAALFPSLIPALAVLIAIPILGEMPVALQWVGVVIITLGMVTSLITRGFHKYLVKITSA